jgi:hypothetical protein
MQNEPSAMEAARRKGNPRYSGGTGLRGLGADEDPRCRKGRIKGSARRALEGIEDQKLSPRREEEVKDEQDWTAMGGDWSGDLPEAYGGMRRLWMRGARATCLRRRDRQKRGKNRGMGKKMVQWKDGKKIVKLLKEMTEKKLK